MAYDLKRWETPIEGADVYLRTLHPADADYAAAFYAEHKTDLHLRKRGEKAIRQACHYRSGTAGFLDPRKPETMVSLCLWRRFDLIGTDAVPRVNDAASSRVNYLYAATALPEYEHDLVAANIQATSIQFASKAIEYGWDPYFFAGFFDVGCQIERMRRTGFLTLSRHNEALIDSEALIRVLYKFFGDVKRRHGQAHIEHGVALLAPYELPKHAAWITVSFAKPVTLPNGLTVASYEPGGVRSGYWPLVHKIATQDGEVLAALGVTQFDLRPCA